MLQYVQQVQLMKYEPAPLMLELQQGKNALQKYWSVGEDILERSGNGSKIDIYREYLAANDEDLDDMELEHPWIRDLKKTVVLARQIARESDPKLDAFLVRWGYSPRPRHEDNLDRVDQIRRTPVYMQAP